MNMSLAIGFFIFIIPGVLCSQTFISAEEMQLERWVSSRLFDAQDGSWIITGSSIERDSLQRTIQYNSYYRSSEKWKFLPISQSPRMPRLKFSGTARTINGKAGWIGGIDTLAYTFNFEDWYHHDLTEPGREVQVYQVNPYGGSGAVVYYQSYVVTHRDTFQGTTITTTDKIANKILVADSNSVRTLYTDSNQAYFPYSNIVQVPNGTLISTRRYLNIEAGYMVVIAPDGTVTTVDAPADMPLRNEPTYTLRLGNGEIWCFYYKYIRDVFPWTFISVVVYNEATGQSVWRYLPELYSIQYAATNGELVIGSGQESGIVIFKGDKYWKVAVYDNKRDYEKYVLGATFVGQDSVAIAIHEGLVLYSIKELMPTSVLEPTPGIAVTRVSNVLTFVNMLDGEQEVHWELYDILGRRSAHGVSALGQRHLIIESSSLPKGTYNLMLTAHGKVLMKRAVMID